MAVEWVCKDKKLMVGAMPLIMGILNVTPDSFSDGGLFASHDSAVAQADALIEQGADILDIGGESTRPGADEISAEEELNRVIPVISGILKKHPDAVLSIDTMKSDVAAEALASGACIINDVSAMTHDPNMIALAVESRAGAVLMHMQGSPRTMQHAPTYTHVVEEVGAYLKARTAALKDAGAAPESIAIDPGIGFGKTLEHNLALLQGLPYLKRVKQPLVVGLSRKSFIGMITGREVDQRLPGSLAAACYSMLHGANILRVHDVGATRDAVAILAALNDPRRDIA
ncbi:MAG: dihydropteroate synthase [Kiritimatiellae bacterium]|nr:dihydropteroate synthase [Kiritimatiellia bacterium]